MKQIIVEDSLSDVTVMKWALEFKWGWDNTDVDPLQERLKTSTADKQVDAIDFMILVERHLILQHIAKSICIISGSVHNVLTEIL